MSASKVQPPATTLPQAAADAPCSRGAPCHYRGRIAPSPTGLLHLGHAQTFRTAWQRARAAGGSLVYRQEDLDPLRCTAAFAQAAIEDLRRYGLDWDEGPDCTPQGTCAPYCQSQRTALYRAALCRLIRAGFAYPDAHSRNDINKALSSGLARPTPPLSGEQDAEAIFPEAWRPANSEWFTCPKQRARIADAIGSSASAINSSTDAIKPAAKARTTASERALEAHAPSATPAFTNPANAFGKTPVSWRLRIPDGETLCFADAGFGAQSFTAGRDFGDFVLWRRDGIPAYELAVVVDDIAMDITEVVRGVDLLRSTARQLLLYRALEATAPAFYHCPLVLDPHSGERLAKRADALSLRTLLDKGLPPATLDA